MSNLELLIVVAGLVIGFFVVNAFLGQQSNGAAARTETDNEDRDTTNHTYTASSKQHDTGESSTSHQLRIFQCPHCSQRMRVQLPLIGRNSQCKKCGTRFAIDVDEQGNLHVMSDARPERAEHCAPSTPEECLALLGLGPIATSEEIKAAYKRRMKEYHPDKVAHLGEKLRIVATREAQKLNSAYVFLKERGLLKDA